MARLREALKLWTRFGQPAPAMAIPYENLRHSIRG